MSVRGIEVPLPRYRVHDVVEGGARINAVAESGMTPRFVVYPFGQARKTGADTHHGILRCLIVGILIVGLTLRGAVGSDRATVSTARKDGVTAAARCGVEEGEARGPAATSGLAGAIVAVVSGSNAANSPMPTE